MAADIPPTKTLLVSELETNIPNPPKTAQFDDKFESGDVTPIHHSDSLPRPKHPSKTNTHTHSLKDVTAYWVGSSAAKAKIKIQLLISLRLDLGTSKNTRNGQCLPDFMEVFYQT